MIEDVIYKIGMAIIPGPPIITLKLVGFALLFGLISGAALSFFLEWLPDGREIYEYH